MAEEQRDADAAPPRTPASDDIVATTELDAGAESTDAEEEENGIVLDPKNSGRQYYNDRFANQHREIWRPGDGDGELSADYFGKAGPPAPPEKRWRLYQSHPGSGPIKAGTNEPPRYVILDDRATWDVHASKIPRSDLAKYWQHEFGSGGKVRARRPHRGRGAVGDEIADGDERYHFAQVGTSGGLKYYFSGEKNYKPIIYRSIEPEPEPEPTPAEASKRKASRSVSEEPNPKRHGHNQYTPADQMVKNGAEHTGKAHLRRRPHINTFLRRDPSPVLPLDKTRYYGQQPKHLLPAITATESRVLHNTASADEGDGEEDSMWIEQDDRETRKKKHKQMKHGPFMMPSDEHKHSPPEETDWDAELPTHGRDQTGDGSDEGSLADARSPKPRRKKPQQGQSYFDNLLEEQEDAVEMPLPHSMTNVAAGPDSGSYASSLEQELEQASNTIAQQREDIEKLEGDLSKAREEIAELRSKLTEAQSESGEKD